jgi:NADH-quinone oxidoreductase subunit F
MAKLKTMAGSGGIVILDEDTNIVQLAMRTMKFYAHESCGWCIPCREGTTWLRKILVRFYEGAGREEDISLIGDLAKTMFGRTFCALGDAAAMPTMAFIDKYRDEFEAYLKTNAPPQSVPELALI